MATRYIYLPDEINLKLKSEANASSLIVTLLEKHYREDSELSLEEIRAKKEELTKNSNDEALKQLKNLEGELLKKEAEQIKKDNEKRERFRNAVLLQMDSYNIPENKKNELFEEFEEAWKSPECESFMEWIESRGYKLKGGE